MGFTICLAYMTMGIPCPGCGLSRSVANTLEGDLPQALWYNPMGPVVALVAVVFAVTAFLPQARLESFWVWQGALYKRRKLAFDSVFYTYLAFTGVRGALSAFDVWPWWS
ncbi:MAG: DUF2752 domain-containing protein [Proteobacteria bacterium]|nr:DUF2752 domain-containing protein [Pseudomonadota bacterium]MCP4922165.1 DUF2752 domain-containing protein [Pseudomonadota bacterium]